MRRRDAYRYEVSDGATGTLAVAIWPTDPVIVLRTKGGQTFRMSGGEDCRKLARFLRDAIVIPILGKGGSTE